jgi:hypothetical protein
VTRYFDCFAGASNSACDEAAVRCGSTTWGFGEAIGGMVGRAMVTYLFRVGEGADHRAGELNCQAEGGWLRMS